MRARDVREDESVRDLAGQRHHLAAQRGQHQGRQLSHARGAAEALGEVARVGEGPAGDEPETSVHRLVAHADAEVEAPARELVDQRRMRGVVAGVTRVEVGDRGAEGDALGHQRERFAQAHRVAEARAVDALEAAILDLGGELERGAPAARDGCKCDGGKRGVRHRAPAYHAPPDPERRNPLCPSPGGVSS